MRSAFRGALIALIALTPASSGIAPWRYLVFRQGTFVELEGPRFLLPGHRVVSAERPPVRVSDWHVSDAVQADVTGEGAPEWVLLVWRPWRDWPIQQWSRTPSPIAGFQDAAGDSCQLVLLDPSSGRETWAGSALPVPLLSLAVGDVDGDELNEVVALEGDYAVGRGGPADRVTVWRWEGFRFELVWRSEPEVLHDLRLLPAPDGGILAIAIR